MTKPAAPETETSFSLPRALAWTLLPVIAYLAATRVTLPGVDAGALPDRWATRWNMSVASLGMAPIVSGAILVELAVLVIPSLAVLRHGGPEGRRKLGRAGAVVGLALAAFQAFGIATLLESIPQVVDHPGLGLRLMITITLAASTAGFLLLANLASTRGLASGIAVLAVVVPIVSALEKAVAAVVTGQAGLLAILVLLVQAAAVAAATWFLLKRREEREARERSDTYREPAAGNEPGVMLPAPASGLWPVVVMASLFAIAASVRSFWSPLGDMMSPLWKAGVYQLVALPLLALLVVVGAILFNSPARVAAVLARARKGGPSEAELERESRAQLPAAIVESLVYVLGIFVIGSAASHVAHTSLPSAWIALATAIALDALAEQRARRAQPDLVPVWPEHRSYALAAAREALAAAGIPLFARGERLHRLLQFFGPFAPIDLMVPRAEAQKAAKILDEVLCARRRPALDEGEDAGKQPRTREVKTAPIKPSALASLAVLMLVCLGIGVTSMVPAKRARPARTTALEFVEVDDEDELVTSEQANALGPDVPSGLRVEMENVPLGPGKTAPRRYARIIRGEHETLEDARRRLLAWTATLTLPEGDRVALEDASEYDEANETIEVTGARTFLLRGAPVLTAADVVDASASPDAQREMGGWLVRVEFSKEGAARFEQYTAAHIKRRFAILVDGRVMSAPVIQTRIPGGVATITMGTGNLEKQKEEATKLVKALMGE